MGSALYFEVLYEQVCPLDTLQLTAVTSDTPNAFGH